MKTKKHFFSGSFGHWHMAKISMAVIGLSSLALQAADTPKPYTGGIALSQTQKLSEQVLDLPDGNPQPLLALAARHGKARGRITGEVAELIRKQTGQNVPIFIDALRLGKMKEQPDCDIVRLTYHSTAEYAQSMPNETMEIGVCPNRPSSNRHK